MPELKPLTAILIDDEPLALVHLKRLLENQGVQILATSESAHRALELVLQNQPDLLFLDIQMPETTGIQLAAALQGIPQPPLLVFATGHSEYALPAFEYHALDYLLKPISPDRLIKTLTQAYARRQERLANTTPTEKSVAPPVPRYLPVRTDYALRFLAFDEIVYCQSKDKKVLLHTTQREELRTTQSLLSLEELLPEDAFLRTHDSYLVALSQIQELLFLGNHEYQLQLREGTRIPIGRTRYAEVRRRLGLASVSEPPR